MTESEWSACDQPHLMRDYLFRVDGVSGTTAGEKMGNRTSDRKIRLAAAAMLRAVWHGLVAPSSRHDVERLESIAESRTQPIPEDSMGRSEDSMAILTDDLYWTFNNASVAAMDLGATGPSQAALLREVVGNPFRTVTLLPGDGLVDCPECGGSGEVYGDYFAEDGMERCRLCHGKGETRGDGCPWVTPVVFAIAQDVYERRDFALLPVLADALEDAGCDGDSEILSHLRSPGPPHVLGCWALDLVLGKK